MPITAPDGDLYVSPLYLAGCTFTGDPALAPLLDHGFALHDDELTLIPSALRTGWPHSTHPPPPSW
ncbi:hypothetical protein AQJ67_35750 [Streptomyces caeruleatus]|uniref:Uncharacterized protein n=1 Tax=Streptomyces caeruleatus TaxID=661399 RepID=A0A124I773_9ACTN|nr:hypothetical protein AQJ67_35750 [Streptomyces caeruleatus]